MQTQDSLRSLVSGLGDPLRDKLASVQYQDVMLDDTQLLWGYRNSWIVRKIVDIPAYDALRKGRMWKAKKEQITAIESEERRLGLWPKLLQAKQLARLWGGAALVLGEQGVTDLRTPLDVSKIRRGGLPYITVLSRRELAADELERDPISEFHGLPKMYQLASSTALVDVHPSRLIVMIGMSHPDPWNAVGTAHGWGDSVVQSVYSAVTQADSVAANVASLVFEANVDVFHLPGLMESIGSEKYRTKLLERMTLAATAKSITRALLMDELEKFERRQVSFAELPDVIQQFLLMVSGAADIPMTRFIGQSPAGLSSTGEGDMRNYWDRVQSMQTLEIQPAIARLDEAIIRSALGDRPEEVYYEWTPLWQPTEKEDAEIGKLRAETTEIVDRTGLLSKEELRTASINQMIEDGVYPGLEEATASGDGPDFDAELELERQRLERQSASPDQQTPPQQQATDAAPRSLYVSRRVLNAADIIAWARRQGIRETVSAEDLHVTVMFSRTAVDWMRMGESWTSEIKIAAGGPRVVERFGDAIVLSFASSELRWRHQHMTEMGAEHSHLEYQPHVTITWDDQHVVDERKIEAYTGEIVLGPEIFEEINEDWSSTVTLVSVGDASPRTVSREVVL